MNMREINQMMMEKNYKQAYKTARNALQDHLDHGRHHEVISDVRKYLLFINKTDDIYVTDLFCERLIRWCDEKDINIREYAEQCRLLNAEIRRLTESQKEVISQLFELNYVSALHAILSTFENKNHQILGREPNEGERLLYTSFSYGVETNYENNVEALNDLLKVWAKNEKHFSINNVEFHNEDFITIAEQFVPIVRSLRFLYWVCDQISIHRMKLVTDGVNYSFIYSDEMEYKKHALPILREHVFIQNSMRTSAIEAKQLLNWEIEQIDYSKVIEIRESGSHFRLNIDDRSFIDAFLRASQDAYQSHIQIIKTSYIDMEGIKIKEKFSLFEVIIFYSCLKALAILYYEATEHFIKTQASLPIAPYLAIDTREIYSMYNSILSMVFKRKISVTDVKELLDFFTFGSEGLFDLYYKPVVQLVNGGNMIIPSVLMMNNFPKTFLHHLNDVGIQFNDKGDAFEAVVKALFSEEGFTVYEGKFPYTYKFDGKERKGDIDLIAYKDNFIFLGQLKNRLEPIAPRDYKKVDTKISKAAFQANEAVSYLLNNRAEFSKRTGIPEEQLESMEIQSFVLMSCLYGSGSINKGVPVTDISALLKFFDGNVRIIDNEGGTISIKPIRSQGEVQPREFVEFLKRPYFLDPDLYVDLYRPHAYQIGDRMFILRTEKDWYDQFPSSFAAQALEKEKSNIMTTSIESKDFLV